jgi:ABC-type tungstate transport system substrate-binding protein
MLETQQGNWDRAIGLGMVLLLLAFLINFGVTQLQGRGN